MIFDIVAIIFIEAVLVFLLAVIERPSYRGRTIQPKGYVDITKVKVPPLISGVSRPVISVIIDTRHYKKWPPK
jgi:hypothetical protein